MQIDSRQWNPSPTKRFAPAGIEDRLATAVIDFFKDDLPYADVITMRMVLDDWDLLTEKTLIRRPITNQPDGGAFVITGAIQ